MTEYFRITGLNLIPFDTQAIVGADHRYVLGQSPGGMDEPLTEAEVKAVVGRLPQKVRGHALKYGLSKITFPFTIKGSSDPDMEDARHDLTETLEAGRLYIETKGARGTRAVLQNKADAAVNQSYKTIVYGEAMELGGRAVLGAPIKEHWLLNLQMVLYCEPYWRPDAAVTLGPNEIRCPSFEEDGEADGVADLWDARGVPNTLDMASGRALNGYYSQRLIGLAANLGIESAVITAPAAVTDAIAYVWVSCDAPTGDLRAIMRDTTLNIDRAVALFSTSVTTAVGRHGFTWRRLELDSAAIVPASTHELWIETTTNDADIWFLDKAFWKWGTTVIPDEWCDHWLIYNHYDTTEAAVDALHEGHINYFDVDDLKGDVDARLFLQVKYNKIADETTVVDLNIGRRTVDPPRELGYWLEAEDGTLWQWGAAALARCSGGSRCTDAANLTGYTQWTIGAVGAPIPLRSEGNLGRYDVFAAVFTDDITDVEMRIGSSWHTWAYNYRKWRRLGTNNEWLLVRLGSLWFDWRPTANRDAPPRRIRVEYQKGVAGTQIDLDFIWLVPSDEPAMRLVAMQDAYADMGTINCWGYDRTWDFDYEGLEREDETRAYSPLVVQGPPMTLLPGVENRLYFVCISYDVPNTYRVYEAHRVAGPANALEMVVTARYLPQHTSPLE